MKKIPFIYTLVQGAIGKKLVVKHYRYGRVITKFPDMSKIIASPGQRKCRNLFKEAVAFARSVNNDPIKKQQWKKKNKKNTVYNDAIRQYMQAHKMKIAPKQLSISVTIKNKKRLFITPCPYKRQRTNKPRNKFLKTSCSNIKGNGIGKGPPSAAPPVVARPTM